MKKWLMIGVCLLSVFCSTQVFATDTVVTMRDSKESGVVYVEEEDFHTALSYDDVLVSDDDVLFCLDPTTLVNGKEYQTKVFSNEEIITGEKQKKIDASLKEKLSLTTYFGYAIQVSDKHYHYTQMLVWENLGYRIAKVTGTLSLEEYQQFKENVTKKIEQYKKYTSWHNQTVTVTLGERAVLEDMNGLVSQLIIPEQIEGWKIERIDNRLILTPTSSAHTTILSFYQEKQPQHHGMSFIYQREHSQTLGKFKLDTERFSTVRLNLIKKKDVVVHKVDRNGKGLQGANIGVYEGNQLIDMLETDENGNVTFSNLNIEKHYTIKEVKAPDGFLLNPEVYSDELGTITIVDDKQPTIQSKATTMYHQKQSYPFEKHVEAVVLSNLVKDKTYMLVVKQLDTSGKVLKEQRRSFVANGTQDEQSFEFEGYEDTVIYADELYLNDVLITTHLDLKNQDQTVYALHPKIQTYVNKVDDTYVDTINYEGFKQGEVLVKTWITPLGKEDIVVEPTEKVYSVDEKGSLSVALDKVNLDALDEGKYVVMEQIFDYSQKEKGALLAEHTDTNSQEQSFEKEATEETTQTVEETTQKQDDALPETGEHNAVYLLVIGSVCICLGIRGLLIKKLEK
ncbi:hypothetical protein KG091_04745 [Carnobacteriaceae bacterium zg-ZUI78]|nr:hypothetical protein [Carnobacteriaceae bacterium zg-ZUI78]